MMRMMKIMHSLRLILLETIKKREMKIGYGNVFKLKIKKYINYFFVDQFNFEHK